MSKSNVTQTNVVLAIKSAAEFVVEHEQEDCRDARSVLAFMTGFLRVSEPAIAKALNDLLEKVKS